MDNFGSELPYQGAYGGGPSRQSLVDKDENDIDSIYDKIAENIYKIISNVSKLKRMQKQYSTQTLFPGKNQMHKIRNETQNLTTETKNLLEKCCYDKKSRLRRERLFNNFSEVFTEFQSVLVSLIRLEKRINQERRYSIISMGASPPSSFDDRKTDLAYQLKVDNEAQSLAEVEEEAKMIKQLEKDVVLISETFTKLQDLVKESSDFLEGTMDHVDETRPLIEQSTRDLEKSAQLMRKISKRKICIWSIVLVIILILLVIIVVSCIK